MGYGSATAGAELPTGNVQRNTPSRGKGQVLFETIQEVDSTNAIPIFQSSATKGLATMEAARSMQIGNAGNTAVAITLEIPYWEDDTTLNASNRFLQMVIPAGEVLNLPTTQLISSEDANANDGTVVSTLTAPSTDLYVDSGINLGANLEDSDTTVTTGANGTNAFRVGDLIQVGINATTATRIEIMRVTGITSTTVMTVDRALYGTSAADKDSQTNGTNGAVSGANIHFPYFNILDDRSLGINTDIQGRFHSKNFFGLGRSATIAASGILPGSVAFMFYTEAFQSMGLTDVVAATNSGLTSGSTYYINVAVDGGSADEIGFTVGSVNFGGPNGIISKIQAQLDANYYDSSKNLFGKHITVGIINNDIRFTYHVRASGKSIALTAGTSGGSAALNLLAQQNGRIPALADIRAAVVPTIPQETVYDNRTYSERPNLSSIMYDDGRGNLVGAGYGTINYETGEIAFTGPPNAQFKYSVAHSSGIAGRANVNKGNLVAKVYARSTSVKVNTKVAVRVLG